MSLDGRFRVLALAKAWDNISASLWFIPTLLVLAAAVLSAVVLRVDKSLALPFASELMWLFAGTAEGARTILSVIAGSLITVVAVAFSITILAIQQAASRYTPRALRNFTRDRGNQIVLGTYIATFTYALLVLRVVRSETPDNGGFVPALSITVAIVLALVSLGLLIYFIHHASESLQVTYLFATIRRELDPELAERLPSAAGETGAEPESLPAALKRALDGDEGKCSVVRASTEGYLRVVDEEALFSALPASARVAHVPPRVGRYVLRDDTLVVIWPETPLSDAQTKRLQRAFALDRNRSIAQDPLFGVLQLVDIALKALSPGVNDPTTAEQSLEQLGAVVGYVAAHDLPSGVRTTSQGTLTFFNRPTFADYVDESFSQVRRAAKTEAHVLVHCLEVLRRVAERASNADRIGPIRRQIDEIRAALVTSDFTETDSTAVRDAADAVLASLSRKSAG